MIGSDSDTRRGKRVLRVVSLLGFGPFAALILRW